MFVFAPPSFKELMKEGGFFMNIFTIGHSTHTDGWSSNFKIQGTVIYPK